MSQSSTTHGILMSAEMILAYKLNYKSQTRRTRGLDEINHAPNEWKFERFVESGNRKRVFVMEREAARFINRSKNKFVDVRLPYGSAGQSLWFRETWKMWERDSDGKDFLHYRADDAKIEPAWWSEYEWRRPDPVWCKKDVFTKWQPSMFMPALCCRFKGIEVLNVRVERLWDIGSVDSVAEGYAMYASEYQANKQSGKLDEFLTPIKWYFRLWDKLNGKTLPVSSNPWVFVYEFPTLEEVKS